MEEKTVVLCPHPLPPPHRIIVDLLKMNVAPQAVFQTLKAMCAGQRVAESCGVDPSTGTHTTSMTTAHTEARG